MKSKALIIFAKYPDRDVKTRLKEYLSDRERIALYESLLGSTVQRFRNFTGVDVFICFTPKGAEGYFSQYDLKLFPQADGDLGSRMFNAFQYIFNAGYGKAVLIGTDIPDVTIEVVLNAFYCLGHVEVVFGPARDGGYYLIGLKRDYPEIFEGIRWSSSSTLEQSVKKAKALGLRTGFVNILSDLDTIDDLKKSGIVL